eukprot:4492168-Prymnesium_polylepis.1
MSLMATSTIWPGDEYITTPAMGRFFVLRWYGRRDDVWAMGARRNRYGERKEAGGSSEGRKAL